MPSAVNESFQARATAPETGAPQEPAAVVGIRLESSSESRMSRTILGGIAIAIAGCVLAVTWYRGGVLGNRIVYAPVMQTDPGLTARDDYYAVVRRLGAPSEERWRSEKGERQYRVLSYPRQGYSVILMGADRRDMHYIGTMDQNWTPIHSVELPGKSNSYALLRTLERF